MDQTPKQETELHSLMQKEWDKRPPSVLIQENEKRKKKLAPVPLRRSNRPEIYLFGTRPIHVRMTEDKGSIEVKKGGKNEWIPFHTFIQLTPILQQNERTEAVRIQGLASIPKNFKMDQIAQGGAPSGGINLDAFN